jgi:hypothetical protein
MHSSNKACYYLGLPGEMRVSIFHKPQLRVIDNQQQANFRRDPQITMIPRSIPQGMGLCIEQV